MKPYVKPMLDALNKKRQENPEKYNQIATANLPKDCKGEKNGNWRGGITAINRGIRFSAEYKHWRKDILDNFDYECAGCGSKLKLEVHHIISMHECPDAAICKMNGVVLCHECHKNTDSYGGVSKKEISIGKLNVIVKTIPHSWQYYETVGNWFFTPNGTIVILVSDMNDWKKEMLVAIHELVEVVLCKDRGITQAEVDAFDIQFEEERSVGLHSLEDEPGNAPNAPYGKEHRFSDAIERLIAGELHVNWDEYNKTVNEL